MLDNKSLPISHTTPKRAKHGRCPLTNWEKLDPACGSLSGNPKDSFENLSLGIRLDQIGHVVPLTWLAKESYTRLFQFLVVRKPKRNRQWLGGCLTKIHPFTNSASQIGTNGTRFLDRKPVHRMGMNDSGSLLRRFSLLQEDVAFAVHGLPSSEPTGEPGFKAKGGCSS